MDQQEAVLATRMLGAFEGTIATGTRGTGVVVEFTPPDGLAWEFESLDDLMTWLAAKLGRAAAVEHFLTVWAERSNPSACQTRRPS